jgi:hypothetical protein
MQFLLLLALASPAFGQFGHVDPECNGEYSLLFPDPTRPSPMERTYVEETYEAEEFEDVEYYPEPDFCIGWACFEVIYLYGDDSIEDYVDLYVPYYDEDGVLRYRLNLEGEEDALLPGTDEFLEDQDELLEVDY